jgi:hypothetical protein
MKLKEENDSLNFQSRARPETPDTAG